MPRRRRLDMGRQRRGAGALVLAPFPGDAVRRDRGRLRPQAADFRFRGLLACSWAGLAQECGKQMATASTPSAWKSSRMPASGARSSGRISVPR